MFTLCAVLGANSAEPNVVEQTDRYVSKSLLFSSTCSHVSSIHDMFICNVPQRFPTERGPARPARLATWLIKESSELHVFGWVTVESGRTCLFCRMQSSCLMSKLDIPDNKDGF